MVGAVIILRRTKPDVERPYRTWAYSVVPIISIVIAGLLILDLAFLSPATSGIGILIETAEAVLVHTESNHLAEARC